MPSLKGIIHAAGILDDGFLINQTWPRFETVFATKVYGAWNLHQLTEKISLDFFVLFSSIASVIGSMGQGNYAAANAFLDSLAHYRRQRGQSGLSIHWGPWSEVGMAIRQEEAQQQLRLRAGLVALTPEQNLEALSYVLGSSLPEVVIALIDWQKLFQQVQLKSLPLLKIMSEEAKKVQIPTPVVLKAPEFLAATTAQERLKLIHTWVHQQVQQILGILEESFSDKKGFFDMGMDSLMAVELRNRLQQALGESYPLSQTIVLDYPNVNSLAKYLDGLFSKPKKKRVKESVQTAEDTALKEKIKTLSLEEISKLIGE
jgi:acyl carrier protein